MFAMLKSEDGKLIREVKLNNFTRKCGLWQAISAALARFDHGSEERIFIVFDEREEGLLKKLGEMLGFPCLDNEYPPHRSQVKAVLHLFVEDIKLKYFKRHDYVEPTYYPLNDERCLPAYGIVRSNFVEEGGLPTRIRKEI